MDQGLLMKFYNVAEKAAIASAAWNGKGDKIAADDAATSAMREAFNNIEFSGRVVIGEGEMDEAPMLYIGEELGLGGEKIDIAVDPLEGTNLCANNQPNAICTIAVAPDDSLLHAPDTYMEKVACGKKAKAHGKVSVQNTPTENVKAVADALEKPVEEVNVMVLDRERHDALIKELHEVGCRVRLIPDGDVYGCMATALEGSGVDLYLGSGGAPEGVLACVALKAMGGFFEGKFAFRNEDERKRAKEYTNLDLDGILGMDDLVSSDDAAFIAVGVTEGELLSGVREDDTTYNTEGILVDSLHNSVRKIQSTYTK